MTEKMKILQMIEDGEITLEEGIKRISQLEDAPTSTENSESALDILAKIESGEISADEGVQFITRSSTYNEQEEDDDDEEEMFEEEIEFETSTPPQFSDEEVNRWKRWWSYPLYIGIGILILSAFWLNSAYQNNGYSFWFFCSWIPLGIGLLLMTLSWQSRGGPWIHVRVKGESERVAISLPAPLGITKWALRNFGHFIPQLEKTSVDEIILALENTTKNNAPFYVQVDEGENGEHVEVFIG